MLKLILKGMAIGGANVIPGVSGGTIALVFGVYDRLTESVGNYLTATSAKRIEYTKFLIKIMVGVVLGVFLLGKLLTFFYEKCPEQIMFLFIGLILGSLPLITSEYKERRGRKENIAFFLLGGVLPVVLYFVSEKLNLDNGIGVEKALTLGYGVKLFLAGILAGGSMIVPGVSGSLMLLIVGEYWNTLKNVSSMNIPPLIPMALGAGVGVIILSKVMSFLFKKYHEKTIFFVSGIVFFSILELIPKVSGGIGVLYSAISFILGVFIMRLIEKG